MDVVYSQYLFLFVTPAQFTFFSDDFLKISDSSTNRLGIDGPSAAQ